MKQQKPLKDWPIVRLFAKHIPHAAGEVVSGLAQVAMGENPVDVVKSKLEERIKKDTEITPSTRDEMLSQLEDDLNFAKIRNEDRLRASMMQVEAMRVR